MSTTTTPWAAWLRTALIERGWDQADLIRRSRGALDSGTVSRWLAGKVIPQIRAVRVTCAALGVPTVEGLLGSGHLEPSDIGVRVVQHQLRAESLSSEELGREVLRRLVGAEPSTDGKASKLARSSEDVTPISTNRDQPDTAR